MINYATHIDDQNNNVHLPPEQICLSPNYPNPFNSSTQIEYAIPRSAFVTLQIFNIQGQLVRMLVNESKQSSRHTVTWDGCSDAGMSVSSGIYFYQLHCDSNIESQKLLLLK